MQIFQSYFDVFALSSNHIFSGTLTAVYFIDIVNVSEESIGRIRFIFGEPKVFDWHNTIFLPYPCVINNISIYNGRWMFPVAVNRYFGTKQLGNVLFLFLYLSYLEMRCWGDRLLESIWTCLLKILPTFRGKSSSG